VHCRWVDAGAYTALARKVPKKSSTVSTTTATHRHELLNGLISKGIHVYGPASTRRVLCEMRGIADSFQQFCFVHARPCLHAGAADYPAVLNELLLHLLQVRGLSDSRNFIKELQLMCAVSPAPGTHRPLSVYLLCAHVSLPFIVH